MTRLLALAFIIGVAAPSFASDPVATLSTDETVARAAAMHLIPAILPAPARVEGADFQSAFHQLQTAGGSGASTRPHEIGLGGKAGGFTFGMGLSGRAWQFERIGFQADVSHYSFGGVGLLQVAPSVLFVLGEPDLDKSTQVRPYAGGGVNFYRISMSRLVNASDSGLGGQGFVGAELVFAGAPRFGLSGELGYYSTGTAFGASFGGFGLSMMGHYYIR